MKCSEYVIRKDLELAATQRDLKAIRPSVEAELVEVNGWYLYSELKVENLIELVLGIISREKSPDKYSDVCSILSGPEEYLRSTRVFLKS